MDLSDFRQDYVKGALHREDLNADPVLQFEKWFDEALKSGIAEPNAMSLATVGEDMQPSLRTVLLKYFDRSGFVFFTNYTSRKATEIEFNPKVALMFPWVTLERQVVIRGHAEKVGKAESLKYFLSRPRDSQLGAWVSHQSSVISSRSLLEMKFAELKAKFGKGEVPLPSFWGGYRVVPHTVEFWQGGHGRIHDRFEYTYGEDGEWEISRLAP